MLCTWREVLDSLQKCGAVGGWTSARYRRLECDLRDVVCTAGCGIQSALGLADENGLNVGG
jgi:hypothetical protein